MSELVRGSSVPLFDRLASSEAPGGVGAFLLLPEHLEASIARELSYNDPQGENGRDGLADRRGTPADRNVELLIPNPYS